MSNTPPRHSRQMRGGPLVAVDHTPLSGVIGSLDSAESSR